MVLDSPGGIQNSKYSWRTLPLPSKGPPTRPCPLGGLNKPPVAPHTLHAALHCGHPRTVPHPGWAALQGHDHLKGGLILSI